eukprot:scaffold248432_cov80-Cyclotella_meneghiniana.AAC.1
MAEGRIEEALGAEVVVTSLATNTEYKLNPQVQFAGPATVQVKTADFVDTNAIPETEDVLTKTFSFAARQVDDGILDKDRKQDLLKLLGYQMCGMLNEELLEMLGMGKFDTQSHLPKGVSLEILRDIFSEISAMKDCHDELEGISSESQVDGEGSDGEQDSVGNDAEEGEGREDMDEAWGYQHRNRERDGEDSMDEDSDNQEAPEVKVEFTMNDDAWDAVEKAIMNKISVRRDSNLKELKPPDMDSAKICRYNTKAHFRFMSDEANASVDPLLDSLVNCKLRLRPANYSRDNPVRARMPFEIRTYNNSGFDLDGDIIAMCGDEYHTEIRAAKNFVGYQRVPVPTNLETAMTLCALRDDNDSNKPWDTNTTKRLFKDGEGKKEWFSSVMADSENNLVWAADARTGKIHAFSTVGNKNSGCMSAAKLAFADPETKAQSKFVNPDFGLAKCNNTIIGSSATGLLSAWNISSALEDSSKTIDPKTMIVDELKNFLCGDVHYVGSSNVIVAPLRFDFNESEHSTTIRLYDINAESTVGIFVGTLGEVSVGKQYCVESHNSIFAMSNNVGVVFDTRSYLPVIALHHKKQSGEQILGVPTSSTPVAFTYGKEEDIKCWDLRSPGSHVYTMATGNTIVDNLLWHENTSSLLASTRSNHLVSYGRCISGYQYGHTIDSDDEDEVHQDSYWPWHCNCQYSPIMLQYPFENSRGMHERIARPKSCAMY